MAFDFPSSPSEGQIFNAPGGPSYVFNTPVWKAVGQGQIAIISDTPPASPANGALWYESDSGVLYIWYNDGNSSQWVQVGGIMTPPPPPITLIQGGTISSSVASIPIVLTNALSAGYRSFQLRWGAIVPSVADTWLGLQVSTDGGATFQATGYNGQMVYALSTASGTPAAAINPTTAIELSHLIHVSGFSTGACDFNVGPWFESVSSSKSNSSTSWTVLHGSGNHMSAVNAVRMIMNGGNITAGSYGLYGYRTS